MTVEAIGITNTTADSSVPRNAGIAQEDFLRILITQLQFQDPLKPVDNQQFVAQLAQFSALEITRQQSESVDTLLTITGTNRTQRRSSRCGRCGGR
jgi:flagellar basal-body rod modification protein FlgD